LSIQNCQTVIGNAMILLREELSAYMVAQGDPATVTIENIGLFETDNSQNLDNSLILSVVNIEEESTLKNGALYTKLGDGTARYENRPVFLNLYVLFTSTFSGGVPPNNAYVQALKRLSLVIQFFQGKNTFTPAASPVALPPPLNDLSNPAIAGLRIIAELYTLTFEQINHLWGSLGGRQVPFVMYKMRLVMITERTVQRIVPLIEEIETNIVKISDNP
jgi:hypothetical protein